MKRNQALSLYNALMAVKLNKMSEEMTDAILADTIELAEVANTLTKVQEELRKRTIDAIDKGRRESYDEMVTKMNALEGSKRAAINALINDSYKDVRKALQTYSKALERWLDKDIKIELQQVERKDFIKALKDAEQEMTPADMERLAPVFKGYEVPKDEVDMTELDELLAE